MVRGAMLSAKGARWNSGDLRRVALTPTLVLWPLNGPTVQWGGGAGMDHCWDRVPEPPCKQRQERWPDSIHVTDDG